MKVYILFWTKALFFLVATYFHELSHYMAAKLTGSMVTGFSLVPRIHRNKEGAITGYEYGNIKFHPKIRVLNFIPGLAPVSLWVALWYLLTYVEIIVPLETSFTVNYQNLFDPAFWWVWLMSIQLFIGGFPSPVDIKLSYMGFFSFSGIVFLSLLGTGYIYFDELLLYMDKGTVFWNDKISPLWYRYVIPMWEESVLPFLNDIFD